MKMSEELEEGVSLDKIRGFSIEELLGMAVKSEIGSREFYESLARRTDVQELKEKMEWLANEEKKHEELLRKIHATMFPGKELVFPEEHVGPELRPVARELKGVQDLIDLIRWAMKAEEVAARFYAELENVVEGEDRKRLMRYLSEMEWSHYYSLKAEYELILDWEMYSQMMHVGP